MITGRRVLVSHYANAKLAVVKAVLDSCLHWGLRTLVVDENLYMVKYGLVSLSSGNLLYAQREEELKPNVDVDLAMFVEPSYAPRNPIFKNVLVTVTPSYGLRIPRFYARSVLKRVVGNVYLLELTDLLEKFRLHISGVKLAVLEDKPRGFLGVVLDVLRRSVYEFGELSVKDAVNIISRELGLDTSIARRYVYQLAEGRFIEVKKGRVIVY